MDTCPVYKLFITEAGLTKCTCNIVATSTVCHLHSREKENNHLNKKKSLEPTTAHLFKFQAPFLQPYHKQPVQKRGLETYMSFEVVNLRSISSFDFFFLKYSASFHDSFLACRNPLPMYDCNIYSIFLFK